MDLPDGAGVAAEPDFPLVSGAGRPCLYPMHRRTCAAIHFPPLTRMALLAAAALGLTGRMMAEETAKAGPGGPLEATASRGVVARDPSTIIREGDTFWIFYTGRGVRSLHSKDLTKWERGPDVFDNPPEWIAREVPKNDGVYWAPDVMKIGGKYLLHYSVSSFGAMHSAIGLATNPTLDPKDPAFRWTDHEIVVRSQEGGDFNTIDPSVFHDDDGKLWLSFGSQWSGLKLVELDPATGKRLKPDEPMHPIAAGPSIEAPWIHKRKGFYYLFLNRGNCCAGAKSTYHITVGRSEKIAGPYVAKDGGLLLEGGGTLVLDVKTGPLTGPGHAGIIEKDGKSWFSCHFEADDRMQGKATLGVMPMRWSEDGWPEVLPPDKGK
jgi:arabinan endo-1,5-alpha-L-arabinosidase